MTNPTPCPHEATSPGCNCHVTCVCRAPGGPCHTKPSANVRPPSAILKWFRWDHLPKPLQETSAKFAALAHEIEQLAGDPAEKATALRKLLEAKDAAVRAAKVD